MSSDSPLPPDAIAATAPSSEPPTRADVEAALRFLNHHTTEARLEQAELTASLRALVDTLVSVGAMPHAEFERRRQRNLDSAARAIQEQPAVKLGPAVDKYAVGPLPDVDCAALMPLCKARCCTLTVWCSAQDLDERVVQWDYARPYQIRKRDDGYCVHSEHDSRRCTIYAQRPAVCRTYDCRQDRRIWQDFDRRIPADA
jgi:Fe-S-cluster containining protein